jgi:glycosyltransferase involved in cell wall biosynthesis
MSSQRVLIVTYYWPPLGGSGVQRWLKFAKYLDRAGWEVTVITPDSTSFTIRDESLVKDVPANVEVLRLPIWEPYNIFYTISRWLGKEPSASDLVTTGRKSIFQKISSWIRGNFFIPDARVFWVRPAVRFIEDIIKSNSINTIITTGPPHSISEWDLLDTLSLTSLARRRHSKLERQVLRNADEVITIAPFHVKRFAALGGRKVHLITNGFDEEDFNTIKRQRTDKFTVRHTGELLMSFAIRVR